MLTFNSTFKVKEMSLNLEIMKSFLNIEIFLKTIDQLFAEIFQRFFLCLLPEDDQTRSSPIFCVDLSKRGTVYIFIFYRHGNHLEQ